MRDDRHHGLDRASGSGPACAFGGLAASAGQGPPLASAGRDSKMDQERSWSDLRRARAAEAPAPSPWWDALIVGLAMLSLAWLLAVVGCGGVARTTAGCVAHSATVCEHDSTWLDYALCLADDALPCAIGSLEAGQSGCSTLTQCVEKNPCYSELHCRQAVELCLDECR